VTFEETIARSIDLDRHLKKSVENLKMPITDGEPILSLSDLIADIKAAKNALRVGIHRELAGMAADIRANGAVAVQKVRDERRAVRDELTGLLGNEIVDTSEDQTKSDGGAGA
jgi:hypothetical protein